MNECKKNWLYIKAVPIYLEMFVLGFVFSGQRFILNEKKVVDFDEPLSIPIDLEFRLELRHPVARI